MASNSGLEILWRGEHLLAINKPAGVAVIPGRGEAWSVLQELGRQLGIPCAGSDDPRVRVVHRLDKDTTGVLLFATNAEAQRHLSHQFQNNTIEKQYVALVSGRPDADEGEIDGPLAPHPNSARRMAIVKHGGRPARTLWKVEERFGDYTLLRVFPKTGKTHQIRVHLQSIGLPLAIDPLYHAGANDDGICLSTFKRGYRSSGEPEKPLISRLTLHAHRLQFLDQANQRVEIEAPLPKDFRAVLNMLRKYSRSGS